MMKQLAKTIGLMVIAAGNMNCFGGDQLGPATCKEAKEMYGASADGPQTLYVDGDKSMPWAAHCVGMASDEPKEFIDLPQFSQNGAPANYSEFSEAPAVERALAAAGTAKFNVQTMYQKVRIDPKTLTIDITNKTFTRSAIMPPDSEHASVALDQAVGYMPFGVAMQCGADTLVDANGERTVITANANIDLTGLPFELDYQQLCSGVGGSRAIADPSTPTKIIDFHAQGSYTADNRPTCGRASVRCLPDPTVNGQIGGETTIQLRYVTATPGFGF